MSGYQPFDDSRHQQQQYAAANPYAQQPQPDAYYGQQQPQYHPHHQAAYVQPAVYQPPAMHGQQAVYSAPLKQPLAGDSEAPDYGDVDPQASKRFPRESYCRDPFWAAFFIVHVVGMMILAGVFWSMYSKQLTSSSSNTNNNDGDEISLSTKSFEVILIVLALGIIAALAWLELFKRYASTLIWIALFFSPVMCLVLAAIFFVYLHAPVGGVIMLIMAAIGFLYLYFVRSRIEFSASILTISVQVLQSYPATTGFAFLGALFQLAWIFVWVIAAAGAMHSLRNQEKYNPDGSQKNNEDGPIGMVWFLLLISFYWTLQVFKNVVHVTAAGVMGTWYFLAPNNLPENPTVRSFQRATWSSFGSICFGSFIISVVKALRNMAQGMSRAEHPVVRCIVVCVLQCLERAVEFFNQFAFTEIAIYGKPYCQAASDTFNLLKSAGVTALINDSLIGSALFLAAFVNGLLGAAMGCGLAYSWKMPLWGLWLLIGFLIAIGMSMIVFEVIESAVTAFFVCYAEAPFALQDSKPHVYQHVVDSIQKHRTARPQIFINQPNPIRQRPGVQQQSY